MDVGVSLGGYKLVRRLGKGGMGEVFEAEHERTGLRVGLKVLHRELSGNKEMVERFYLEARTASKIGCPHIVDVTDVGHDPKGVFLVMELLAGESLGDRLARETRLPLDQALGICAQIADALDSAHGAGVIHRDLKPDNIFLVPRPEGVFVKLLDFGLAKMLEGGGPALTKAGVVLGTPEYMSPEQAESKKDIDTRADVYALGILLYQCTTGYVPFVGKSMGEVLVKHISRSPASPRTVLPSLPEAVEQIIMRCLAKRREDRYQTMADLRAAILDPAADLAWRGPAAPFGARRLSAPTIQDAAAEEPTVIGQPEHKDPAAVRAAAEALLAPRPQVTLKDSPRARAKESAAPPQPVALASRDAVTAPIKPVRPPRRWILLAALAVLFAAAMAITWALLPGKKVSPPAAVAPTPATPAARPVALPPPPPPSMPPPAEVPAARPPTRGAASGGGGKVWVPDAPAPGAESSDPPGAGRALPGTVHVRIETRPAGAKVYRKGGGPSLGTTPVTVTLESSAEQQELLLVMEGYDVQVAQVAGSSDSKVEVAMTRGGLPVGLERDGVRLPPVKNPPFVPPADPAGQKKRLDDDLWIPR